MIKIVGVKKIYRMGDEEVRALNGVDLEIAQGDYVAIMGPSGSGKSTLMHILGLLDVPDSGEYFLNGKLVSNLSENELSLQRRTQMGFIFQQFHLLPRLEAWENVSLPLFYSEKKFDRNLAMELLKKVGLEKRAGHVPSELSGGQQQRVAIARALINSPKIIFADEPTGNLDSNSEKEIMQLLETLNAQGITIIIVTHEEEIGKRAKRIIRMRDGKVTEDLRLRPVTQAAVNPAPLSRVKEEVSRLFELKVHFVQAVRSLLLNKVRTALSTLGILIGVAAVVAMLALGNGAQKSIESQLSSLGSNLLVLRTGSIFYGGTQKVGAGASMNVDDPDFLKEKIPYIARAAPVVYGEGQTVYQNQTWKTQIQGVSTDYPQMRAATPTLGRFFTEEENKMRARVAVLGTTVVRELFGDRSPLGENIKINKINFQVIGVLPAKGATGWRDQDDIIVIPVLTAMYRVLGKTHLDSIDLEVRSPEYLEVAQTEILNQMNIRHRILPIYQQDAFQIRNMADIQAALTSTSKIMGILLSFIAAISLLVGGIGIMNIMLVSVTERTKEIGLRKAIGGEGRDILMQFLIESSVIGLSGGTLGILLGSLISVLVDTLAGWASEVGIMSVIGSFSFSVLVGLIFGIFPALKASKLHPIVALRHD